MSDVKPSEWKIHNGEEEIVQGPFTGLGLTVVVPKTAYDAVSEKLKAAEAEIERLKDEDVIWKRLCRTKHKLTKERECNKVLREALERIQDNGGPTAGMGFTMQQCAREALAKEKEVLSE